MRTQPDPAWKIPTPKLILEGTHLTRKTDIAFRFAEHPRVIGERLHRWHIPLVSAEWETRCEEQPTKGSPGYSLIDHPPWERPWAMHAYHLWACTFEVHRDFYWVVDRFHFSTTVFQQASGAPPLDFRWLERRLGALDFRLALLTRSDESFEQARVDRLRYSENPGRYSDLTVFMREQNEYRALAEHSLLKVREFDVTDDDVDRVTSDIIDWLEETDAMYRA